jgi:hypothetical protein
LNLETYSEPDDLYRARADEVNPNRPLFTGDIFDDVPIPGAQEHGMALVLAHPCSFRIGAGRLADRVLVAAVREISKQGRKAWTRGLLDRMPLPDLAGTGMWAAFLEETGRAYVEHLLDACRLACLSESAVNMLQQRLTCHLTRVEVPTHQFSQAFSHTYEEADLLEDWTDMLTEADERLQPGEPWLPWVDVPHVLYRGTIPLTCSGAISLRVKIGPCLQTGNSGARLGARHAAADIGIAMMLGLPGAAGA